MTNKIPRSPYLIILIIAAFLFGMYCLAGFFFVPILIEKKLPEYTGKRTGMELNIGNTRFNPFSFRLHLQNITVFTASGSIQKGPFISIADLKTVLAPMMLFHGEIVCRSIQIEKLSTTIIRYPDNNYNISQLFGSQYTGGSNKKYEFPDLPFLYSLNNISVTDSSLIFDDRVLEKVHKVKKIALTLPTLANFSYKSQTSVSPSFSAIINGSPIQLTGEADVPGSTGADQTRLSFDLHALDLPLYFNYLPLSFPVQLTKGTAEGQLQISFVPGEDHSQRLTVLFQLDTKDGELSSKDHSFDLSVPTAKLEGEFQPFTGNLHFRNILFHEPGIRLESNFSGKTLDSLLPSAGKSQTGTLLQRSVPKFTMDLFIMDNGSLQIDQGKKTDPKTYRSLQLSIKNYSNQPQINDGSSPGGCSFKLSGEQLSPPASFSWQGKFNEKNTAQGTLQLNRFPASLLGTIFTQEKNTSMSGTADMTGNLSVQRSPGAKTPFSYSISKGSVKISNLRLSDKKNQWLQAAAFSLGPLESKGKTLDIGKITIKDASLKLMQSRLPHFLDAFVQKGSRYKIHSLDFTGSVSLSSDKVDASPLVFHDLDMRANQLDNTTNNQENLALSGKIHQSGRIKATGTVSLNPFNASLTVQFSGIPCEELLPWYTDSPLLSNGQGLVDGLGKYIYPEGSYKGTLAVTNALFDNRESKSKLTWNKAEFQDLELTKNPFHLSIVSANIDQPVITFTQPDDTSNILSRTSSLVRDLLPRAEKKKNPEEPTSPDLTINKISLQNGMVFYNDLRLSPPWRQQITDFSGVIQNISRPSAKTAAEYSFSGTMTGSPIMMKGVIAPFNEKFSATSMLTLSRIPIADLQDQLSHRFSLDYGKGTFDLTLQDVFQDGKESGEAQFLFRGLSPASSTSDTALLLALLADKHDTFKVNLPLIDPNENKAPPVFSETVKYFKRLVVKSMIAPLLLTNDNFSQLAFDNTPDFLSGESILSAKGKAKLTLYRDLLVAHPRLTLNIVGMVDKVSDQESLMSKLKKEEERRVEEENNKRLQEWNRLQMQPPQTGQHTTIVEKDIPADQLAKYTPIFPKQITVSEKDMENLARQRTTTSYDFLTQQLGLSRDRVSKRNKDLTDPAEQANKVHITLGTLVSPENSVKSSSAGSAQ